MAEAIGSRAPLMRWERVNVAYGETLAVRDASFSLGRGEILGIVGASGSGKSTLLHAAMGILGPGGAVTRGHIWYGGLDLAALSGAARRAVNGARVGMIFQDAGASFCPVRTVGAQLYEAAAAHGAASKQEFLGEAAALLQSLRIENAARVLESYPFELSGGMMQRVGVAAAVLLRPAVLLADEPTGALDAVAQKQAVDELLQVRARFQTSIVIVTHNIGVVRAMADRVVVMRDGAVVESGGAKDVLARPQMEYTKKLLAASPRLRR